VQLYFNYHRSFEMYFISSFTLCFTYPTRFRCNQIEDGLSYTMKLLSNPHGSDVTMCLKIEHQSS